MTALSKSQSSGSSKFYFFVIGLSIGAFVVAVLWWSSSTKKARFEVSAIDADKARGVAFKEVVKKIGSAPTQPAISESFLVRMSPRRIDVHFEVVLPGSKDMPRSEWIVVTEEFDDGTWHATYGQRIQ